MHSNLSSHNLSSHNLSSHARHIYRTCILTFALVSLLTACATQTTGHLPKQGVYTQARLIFQMQYVFILAKQELTESGIQLQIETEILTQTLPPWATQLEAGNLDIYLVDADNAVITTQSHTLPSQNLSDTPYIQLETKIPLGENLLEKPLFLAFGYCLHLTDSQKTQRMLLTEMACKE